jgi:hypothetical protein
MEIMCSYNVQPEASRTYRIQEEGGGLKGKINDLESKSKNKNARDLYRSINTRENGYQFRTYFIKD